MDIYNCGFSVGDIVTASDWKYNTPRHKAVLVRGRILALERDADRILASIEIIKTNAKIYQHSSNRHLTWYTKRLKKIQDKQCSVSLSEMFAI